MKASRMLIVLAMMAGALVPVGHARAGSVPKPTILIERGDKCVEDVAVMRREHMNMLKHERDETVHRGIRNPRYSLTGCIECHASRKTNSVIGNDQNFCQSCHAYAAVKLDCFECHASKPKAQGVAPSTAVPAASGTSSRGGVPR